MADYLLPIALGLGLLLIFWGARHGATCRGGCRLGCPEQGD